MTRFRNKHSARNGWRLRPEKLLHAMRCGVLRAACCAVYLHCCWSSLASFAQEPVSPTTPKVSRLILVVGAPGTDEYGQQFKQWAEQWLKFANEAALEVTPIGLSGATDSATGSDKLALQQAIGQYADATGPLWIVLLGHGTASRNIAKFNLVGEDVSSSELAAWLKPKTSELVVVNCSSASASFLTDLSGPGRVIVTATRSGSESNYARFGKYLSESLSNLQADIDHDQEVSLLEAFLMATSQTERFYEQDARLTTEHALLDDNGDRNGVTGDFYQGIRPVKVPKQGQAVDGLEASRAILYSSPNAPQFTSELAGQRAQLERQLDSLRSQKTQLSEAEYFGQLEALLLELAHLYDLAEG